MAKPPSEPTLSLQHRSPLSLHKHMAASCLRLRHADAAGENTGRRTLPRCSHPFQRRPRRGSGAFPAPGLPAAAHTAPPGADAGGGSRQRPRGARATAEAGTGQEPPGGLRAAGAGGGAAAQLQWLGLRRAPSSMSARALFNTVCSQTDSHTPTSEAPQAKQTKIKQERTKGKQTSPNGVPPLLLP